MIRFVPFQLRRPGLLDAAFAYLLAVGSCIGAHAQDMPRDASTWVTDQHSSVRLIAGSRNVGVLLGAIDLRLQPGWKTYWRTPGDSGVPPRFDFSGSDNIKAVTVLWPAPTKFDDGAGGTSYGYKTQVTLPVRIIAKKPKKPVTLRVAINYAVCEKLCVPVEAKTEVSFVSAASAEDSSLIAALETVPQPAKIGDPNGLAVRAVKRNGKTVTVDVVTADAKDAELFVEGPTPEWALPPPKLLERTADGVQRFSFDLDGLPSGASPEGAALKLTLTGSGHAYEYDTILD